MFDKLVNFNIFIAIFFNFLILTAINSMLKKCCKKAKK